MMFKSHLLENIRKSQCRLKHLNLYKITHPLQTQITAYPGKPDSVHHSYILKEKQQLHNLHSVVMDALQCVPISILFPAIKLHLILCSQNNTKMNTI